MSKHIGSRNRLVRWGFLLIGLTCLYPAVTAPVALIAGFVFVHFFGNPFEKWNRKAVSLLLKIAVVGLGFGMEWEATLAAGISGFGLTASSIAGTLGIGWLLGKILGLPKRNSYLISSGTAICGGSAIAAVAPIIDADERDISIALGVVFLYNSMSLLIFPPLGHFFQLSESQFGLWCAVAIHDTSSVVGAAMVYGPEAVEVATTVKLVRALWIIPLSFFSLLLFQGKGKRDHALGQRTAH